MRAMPMRMSRGPTSSSKGFDMVAARLTYRNPAWHVFYQPDDRKPTGDLAVFAWRDKESKADGEMKRLPRCAVE